MTSATSLNPTAIDRLLMVVVILYTTFACGPPLVHLLCFQPMILHLKLFIIENHIDYIKDGMDQATRPM